MSADFVKYDLGQQRRGAVVNVTLDRQANVHLMDASNFSRYRRADDFRAVGGRALRSPLSLTVPNTGHWYVVLDLGGGSGTIRSDVRVLEPA